MTILGIQINSNSKKIRIRFVGLAALGGPNKEMIEAMSGYTVFQDGNDWVVYEDDPRLTEPAVSYLTFHPEGLPLQSSSYAEVAQQCLPYLNTVFEQKPLSTPNELTVAANLGPISELDHARTAFFWTNLQHLEKALVEQVFPRLEKLGAKRVFPVTLDAAGFYRTIALPKISCLNRIYGLDIARDKVLQERVLDTALPSPLEPLHSLDALLFAPPYAMALPLHRVGSALLFTARRAWQFPTPLTMNVFDLLDATNEPFSTNTLDAILLNEDLSRGVNRAYIDLAVYSINNLTNFLCNPLNFLDQHGEFDELRLLKANSLVRLLVADVKAINTTSSFHGKTRLIFQFIDKLANLSVEMTNPLVEGRARKMLETETTNRFYDLAYLEELKSVLRYHGRARERRLGDTLVKIVSRIQARLKTDIHSVFKKANKTASNEEIARYFRTMRNLGHGTYLDREQFENLFLKLNPVIPTELTYLPWLSLLALGLAPKRILRISESKQ